jgi:environmental stress-induced protein Ves
MHQESRTFQHKANLSVHSSLTCRECRGLRANPASRHQLCISNYSSIAVQCKLQCDERAVAACVTAISDLHIISLQSTRAVRAVLGSNSLLVSSNEMVNVFFGER